MPSTVFLKHAEVCLVRTACLFGVTVPTGRVTAKGCCLHGGHPPPLRDVHENRMGWWDSLSFIYLATCLLFILINLFGCIWCCSMQTL